MNNSRSSMVTDLTQGSVTGMLLRFTLPLLISNTLQAIYNLVDMIVVGHYIGGTGMSAVSIGGDILHLITFLAMGFSSAGQVIIAQQVGAGRHEDVNRTIGTLFSFLLLASLALTVVCLLLRENILTWLNTPAESRKFTMDYTVTCVYGLFFIYGYNIVSAILRGMGDSKRPFVFIAVAAVLNMVLDVVFVAFFGMEVYGAALATVIGQGVSFIASLIYLYAKRESFGFDFKPKSFRMDPQALKGLVALGVPMAIQSAAVSLSKIVISAWVNAFGWVSSAMGGVYNKMVTVSGVVSQAFTTAGASMVGQNLGAGRHDRVPGILKVIFWISMLITVIASAAMAVFSGPIFRLFTSDGAVLAGISILVAPIIVNLFGSATRSVAFALINGCGNTRLNLAVALIDGLISRMALGALLGYTLKLDCLGFWYGDAIAGFVPIIIGMLYFLFGNWREVRVK